VERQAIDKSTILWENNIPSGKERSKGKEGKSKGKERKRRI